MDVVEQLVNALKETQTLLKSSHEQLVRTCDNMACNVLLVAPNLGRDALEELLKNASPVQELMIRYSHTRLIVKMTFSHNTPHPNLAQLGQFDQNEAAIVRFWKDDNFKTEFFALLADIKEPIMASVMAAGGTRIAFLSTFNTD